MKITNVIIKMTHKVVVEEKMMMMVMVMMIGR